MPISLEQFRKLESAPSSAGVKKFSRKCDWDKVYATLGGQAWTVKEAHGVASKFVGDKQTISRVRVKRYLDTLVKKNLAVAKYDGFSFTYWINPPVEVKAAAQKTK